jgi:hypothetical protein
MSAPFSVQTWMRYSSWKLQCTDTHPLVLLFQKQAQTSHTSSYNSFIYFLPYRVLAIIHSICKFLVNLQVHNLLAALQSLRNVKKVKLVQVSTVLAYGRPAGRGLTPESAFDEDCAPGPTVSEYARSKVCIAHTF